MRWTAASRLPRWMICSAARRDIVAAHASGLELFVIDAPHLYARDGDPYRGPDGREWPDNAFRFAALSRVAVLLAQGLVAGYRPDVVHAHDWQAGLTPAYLHYAGAIEPADRDDDPQSRVPGSVSSVSAGESRTARGGLQRIRASSITALSAS